ncbi:general secretion pathway protein GspB [Aestuariibacter sp. A3R04]|uniref:general secretion pathway protein GspB n=1 Tax=Aestuariibacter sp. A3R04 TaxID=2841571 RepID=UPI001C08748B|nr:general secretion pathway protein GspB [Aestuariibacter sp. A3R04]MBU3022066.1 general secretion pathway protein GspB [Aestuariibacter sp. A3R04]
MSDKIDITDLKPGMVIVKITKQNGPVKIRKSGLVTSEAMVQGLAEMGVLEIEVDHAQTVEIDTQKHHRTETQALIRGERDTTAASLDRNISDQFNRSLFLPTVQGLPSMWKVYAKQGMSFATVVLFGLALGFGVGSFPHWWQSLGQVSITVAERSADNTVGENPKPVTDKVDTVSSQEAVARQASSLKDPPPQAPVNSASEDTPNTVEQGLVAESRETSKPQEEINSRPPGLDSVEEPEGEIINAPPQNKGDVSPELLARFNQALEELDNKATEFQPKPQVVVRDDLPRVDQLPVRMLTRLPSMAFNAHMYASRPSDRWVRVNGVQLSEGDWINDEVQIVKIEAQRVILNFEGKNFSMAALTDW